MDLPFHAPLSPEIQRAHGIASPQPLAMADRVRFAELDVLRHVNNKAYMTWFETLRVVYNDMFILPLYPDGAPVPRVVLRSGEVRYIEEMLMGEDYIATTAVTAVRTTSYTMEQQLWAAGRLRATFSCVLVMLHPDGSGRYPLPDAVRRHVLEVDGAQDQT